MPDSPETRLQRARLSLEGLSVADALGGFLEMQPVKPERAIERRIPNVQQWHFTDDTNMALSIYAILRRYGKIEQEALAQHFAKYYERSRGYGAGARRLLSEIRGGGEWRDLSKQLFGGGSFGNGGAMRIAPLGAYFADDMDALIENARLATEITHAHPEGIAGGIVVAAAAAIAWQLRGQPKPTYAEFIEKVLPFIPDGVVKQGCIAARELPENSSVVDVVEKIGNGQKVTAQDTVPFVLYNAGKYLDHYVDAFWHTASGGGDVDTTCAMVGGIIALYVGEDSIPAEWRTRREPLPDWTFAD